MANKKDPYGPEIIYRFGPFRIVRVIKRLTNEDVINEANTEIEIRLEKNVGPDAMRKPVWVDFSEEPLAIGFIRLDWEEAKKIVQAVEQAKNKAEKIIAAH